MLINPLVKHNFYSILFNKNVHVQNWQIFKINSISEIKLNNLGKFPGFPIPGAPTPGFGTKTYYLARFLLITA